MAGAQDWISAGIVPQGDVAGGVDTGARLAMAHEQMLAQKQQVQQQGQALEMKKADWFTSQMASASAIVDKNARAMKLKQIQATAPRIGVQIDPAAIDLLKDDKHAQAVQQGVQALYGLPHDQQTSHALDFMYSMGDPSTAEQHLFQVAEMNQRRLALQQQLAHQGFQMENEREQGFQKAKNEIQNSDVNKEHASTIKNANFIQDMALDPEARKNPDQASAAQAYLAKMLFPGGVIRESEMAYLKSVNRGLGQHVERWFQNTEGKGPLTDEAWWAVGQLAQKMGSTSQQAINEQKAATAKNMRMYNADDLYSGIPSFTPKDLRPAFPNFFPQVAAGAQGAQARNTLQAWAAARGVKLAPADPQFKQKLAQLVEQERQKSPGGEVLLQAQAGGR